MRSSGVKAFGNRPKESSSDTVEELSGESMSPSHLLRPPSLRSWSLAIDSMVLMEARRLNSTLALSISSHGGEGLSSADRMAARRLVMETTRRLNFIDRMLNFLLAPSGLRNLKSKVRAFIRLYTFYVWFGEGDKEARAVVAARIGRRLLSWRELNPVEHILGRIIVLNAERLFERLGEFEVIALKTFHPTWFVRYCFSLLGKDEAMRFLEASNSIHPVYLRMNLLKAKAEDIESMLEREGITVAPFRGVDDVYEVVDSSFPLVTSKAYQEGLFFLQDPASCLVVQTAKPQPEWRVLDVCAAPGGKTTHLAQLMEDRGQIISIDLSERRLEVLRREVLRVGSTIVDPLLADAIRPLPVRGEFDLVILDPPCSSTGTFWKTPSAKWRIDSRSFTRYGKLQGRMIDSCSESVRVGGFLVYSTCSISLEENEMVIEKFLENHPDFQLVPTESLIGRSGFKGQVNCQRLYPHINRTNGFFLAKMKRLS